MASRWIEIGLCAADRDALLVRCVGPAVRRLRSCEGVGRTYFLRDDDGVRVRVELLGAVPATVLRTIEARIDCERAIDASEVTLNERPAMDEIDGLWTGPAAADLRDDFFSETTDFMLDCLAYRTGSTEACMQLAFDLMVANAAALDEITSGESRSNPPRAFLSYRSHADGFFIMSKEPAATKRAFDERCEKILSSSVNRLSTLLSQLPEGDAPRSAAATWRATVIRWFPQVLTLLHEGRLQLPVGEDAYLGDYHDISISSFHNVIQNHAEYRRQMREDVNFHCVRVVLSLLYWTLHNLGLRLVERFFLCHLTSLAFERRFGLDPRKTLLQE